MLQNDAMDLAKKGFRQKFGSYAIMTLLVAFTITGSLVLSAYLGDASKATQAMVEPLNFPYLKGTVTFAYFTNPPEDPETEFPAPAVYAPLFNDKELDRIRNLRDVQSLSIALSQDCFSKYGHKELLRIEEGAPLWDDIVLKAGRLPESDYEILVPEDMAEAGATIGSTLLIKKPERVIPKQTMGDRVVQDTPDPEVSVVVEVVGLYEPTSPVISGILGHLPVNRVETHPYPAKDPKVITMDWPVPNTIFLSLAKPSNSQTVASFWTWLYPATYPYICPVKEFLHPNAPEALMFLATSQMTGPLFSNAANSFFLGGIGIFTAMFLSFLDRRRELGIMKTVGIDSRTTARTVSLEIVFTGVGGTVIGVLAAYAIAGQLEGVAGALNIPWTNVVSGMFVASLILVAATFVPRAMAVQGTVMELLNQRAIPIFRNRTSDSP